MKFQKNNIVIGIDTSCYTTSIAAISLLDKEILFNKKIMLKVDKNSKGLRQSEGVFQHVSNLGKISDEINQILKDYKLSAICASSKPRPVEGSYMPVFTVGFNTAKLISTVNNCPFFETTHQENHIEASLYKKELLNKQRFMAVHMSGGTTEIVLVNKIKNKYEIEIIGGTKDVSFGQLLDRLGQRLSYEFPSGKYIDENACRFEGKIESGLKTSVKEGYMNLSGIENQLNKIIDNSEDIDENYLSRLLMDTIVRCMLKSLSYLCEKYGISEVVFAGGVSASRYISRNLSYKLKKYNIKTYFTEPSLASDNAVGCALIGMKNLVLGE